MVYYDMHPEKAGEIVKKIVDAGIPFIVRTRVFICIDEEDEEAVDHIMNEFDMVEENLN